MASVTRVSRRLIKWLMIQGVGVDRDPTLSPRLAMSKPEAFTPKNKEGRLPLDGPPLTPSKRNYY
jgi:hypothetical protein